MKTAAYAAAVSIASSAIGALLATQPIGAGVFAIVVIAFIAALGGHEFED